MDEVFRALADPGRRHLLDSLNQTNGQTLRQLCDGMGMARQSVSKHLAVLEAAGLVTTVRRGREKLHYLNASPVNAIADRWISRYDRPRIRALADLQDALEGPGMGFSYTTYIATTPAKLWEALTDPAFTRQYWGVEFETDWKPGSVMTWKEKGVTIADPEQVVLEAEPGRRLSYTWHTTTPEFAAAYGFDDEWLAAAVRGSRSKVTFDIEKQGAVVKLTVVHDDFGPEDVAFRDVGEGWVSLLASLKTLLETGSPLPMP
ncbi:ArsR/SmtB family transcription factor [Actinoplanes aureus]|uniref:Metalloregulator ArsR/SmtB family transcription factor n=1 Tax=Actinoplanes aureus TaxID=2792083 RepID=A0A931C5Y0_9ACTN|nr:metalloregulator ArsR/SmtB family transcription factor [Actinoplanes aureus]MBG0561636.1 metalloregulator ArsR/SmtB family transcription factor [Actinoplanes aureus]